MRMRARLRPWTLLALLALALSASACAGSVARARGSADVLRLGVFATLTHAPAEVGIGSGIFEHDLAPTRVEVSVFDSGYDAGVALLSGSIDAGYLGPWPAASLYLRSGGVAVVSGATVGGVSFVVRKGAGIRAPGDLHGKRIAVPSIGNSQDVELRTWLHEEGLRATDEGGDVSITAVADAQLLRLFRVGWIDGAWVPEPYPTYLISQGVAEPFVDKEALSPGGGFPSVSLVVSTVYLEEHPDVVGRLVRANVDAIGFAQDEPAEAQRIAEEELVRLGAPAMDPEVIADAWANLRFTWRPEGDSMTRVAQDGYALGLLPGRPEDILGIYRLDALNSVLDDYGLPPVEVPR